MTEDVLKVLTQSNYWKQFCTIEILVIFSKPTIQIEEDIVSYITYFRSSLVLSYLRCNYNF